jgi:uncharacterized repeat protein (TIGR02543 family)
MKKKLSGVFKRILVNLLALTVVVCSIPSTVFAAADEDAANTIQITYTAGEGGTVSLGSETINLSEKPAQISGSTAQANQGYAFVNWTDSSGNVVSASETFAPVSGSASTTYTANFESTAGSSDVPAVPGDAAAADEEAANTIQITYTAGEGGTVSLENETIDLSEEPAQISGSTAQANQDYAFVNWTVSSGNVVSASETFAPVDISESTTYTANFKKVAAEKGGDSNSEMPAIEMPANSFTGSAPNGVTVVASVEEGVFPAQTTMQVAAVSADAAIQAAQSAVSGEIVDAAAVDITFYDAAGNEIQPADHTRVHVTLAFSNEVKGAEYSVIHIEESGAEKIADASATGASFDADSFSIYAIIGQPCGKATITYEFYGDAATPNLLSTSIVKDGDTLIAPATPASTVDSSATFIGWSTADDPTSYQTFGMVSIPSTVTTNTTVKLYARFSTIYHVSFHNQYGAVIQSFALETGSNFHVADYNAYVTFPVPVDQALTGWSTILEPSGIETGLGGKNGKVTDFTVIKDVDLYPILESVYWIVYDSNGGTYTATEFFRLGSNTAPPAVPTRSGYTFEGWYKDEALTQPFTFGSPLSAHITLYAKWAPNNDILYKVAYWVENADNDDYSLFQVDTLYGTVDTLTAAPEQPSNTTMDSNLWALAGSITQKNINGDGSTLVNVYYKRTIKTIHFYTAANEEITNLTITAKWGAYIADLWPSVKYPDDYGASWRAANVYYAALSTMPTAADTSFWYVDYSGGVIYRIYHYKELLAGLTSEISYGGKYFEENPIVDWWWSGGYTWYSTPEDHYDILGLTYMDNITYSNGMANFDANHAIAFYYSRSSYNINFFSSGSLIQRTPEQYEADISDANFTPDTSLAPVSGYHFAGWYDNQDCLGTPVTLSGPMPAHDITLYAKWQAPQYTVRFDLNGGTSGQIADQTNMYGQLVSCPEPPTREGYAFSGWTLGGKAFGFGSYIDGDILDYAVDGIITLQAWWIGGSILQVRYDAKQGTNAPTDSTKYYSSANVVVARAATPPAGKYFLYWALDKNNYLPGDSIALDTAWAVDGIVTLTAVYGEEQVASITYHPNGAGGSDYTTGTVQNNTEITILAYNDAKINYIRNGYTFVGWNTKADGSGTSYAAGTVVYLDNIGSNDLYAQWLPAAQAPDTGDNSMEMINLMGLSISAIGLYIVALILGKINLFAARGTKK